MATMNGKIASGSIAGNTLVLKTNDGSTVPIDRRSIVPAINNLNASLSAIE
jgi:hypothetical protein